MMEKFGISYQELLDLPYEQYLDYRRIARIEAKEEKREAERKQKEAKRNT